MERKGSKIQSVDRALTILECLSGSLRELGVTDIAAQMGLSKSTIHGLVQTLAEAGYLEQNHDNKRYRLGMKLFQLGCLVQDRMDIREIAKPYLQRLSDEFNLTAHMGLYRDYQMVYIDKVDAKNAHIIYSQIGKNVPMYCTGIGKAVFAYLPAQEQTYLMNQNREAVTPNTIIDENDLRQELDSIHKQGYAIDQEEIELGLFCVAVPIFDHQGEPLGALSISGAKLAVESIGIDRIANQLLGISKEISGRMGYRS